MNWASGRAGQIALLLSIGLNLVLGTAIGVHFWRAQHMVRPAAANRADFGVERMARGLPASDREVLRKAYAERAPEIEAAQKGIRAARQELRKTLEADPFVPTAMSGAMEKMDAERDHLQKALQGVFTSAAAEMSAQGRTRLAQRSAGDRAGARDESRSRNRRASD
jgi:uncharacterized membrane protein